MLDSLAPLSADADVAALLAARRPGHTLPAELYTGQAAWLADCRIMFGRHWISVGVACDVPEPGDVIALDIGPSSIVILRDDNDELRAFHNVCSHRGAKLVPAGRSVVGKLVCPYHQWTYDLDGTLALAPHMGMDFDRALHHLKPVALRDVGGLLFACLSDDPPADIDDLAAVMEPRLAPYDLHDTRVAFEQDLIEDGNWKLTMENNRECYHCASNHPQLSLSFHAADFGYDPDGLTETERAESDALADAYRRHGEHWQAEGLPYEAVEHTVGHATNFRTQRLIIAGLGESQTPDTRAASSVPLGQAGRPWMGDMHLWGHNSWNHVMSDHAVVIAAYPVAPDKTLVRTKWLVHKDAVEGEDYDLDNLTAVWKATNAEDAHLVSLAHRGVSQMGYRPGPYSRFTERALEDFATWYVERMAANGYGTD
ncbi:putative dyoxygenase (alpha subunit) oxidoreductase protein [Oceaniovalibus guishaninsula JLT2003]|uniref:Putative dyoxygenase (Alpha subunit) oxidoreductase protein n=1 Tax=Oceaniovalibus guishaninsula JLT2003 TaxID=1231392 RepID=K2I8A7_9RHOB|nr:aromatic ring-hydroxylating dioxygenase subunit alpha [Oceaniovalibus guishaninsula]EKE45275.1 putative dyoxygenase (alpha subunit) oxidoreductase protein [Oceaniovalibus guishaninsula JLT2003]